MTTEAEVSKVEVHYYCGTMLEAISATLSAHDYAALAESEEGGASGYGLSAGMLARYAFFSACVAAEAGANALLECAPGVSASLCSDLEKLQTLNKYEVYALVRGTPLDRGTKEYDRMRRVLQLRNRFFHPKRVRVPLLRQESESSLPSYVPDPAVPALDFLGPEQVIPVIRDVLSFVAWVVCDSCGHSPEAGGQLLSRGIRSTTGELFRAKHKFAFDIRSLGVPGDGNYDYTSA